LTLALTLWAADAFAAPVPKGADVPRVDPMGTAVLGVTLEDYYADPADQAAGQAPAGQTLLRVYGNSAARRAGLQAGDAIIACGTHTINWHYDLREALSRYRPGAVVPITVMRFGQKLTVRVRLGDDYGRTPDDYEYDGTRP
jgi:S1-C subfamily serine protease